MCLANRTLCKQCLGEKRKYYAKCDLYPKVKDETPTHSIRGRHRRIIACKACKRKNRRDEEEAEQRNVSNYPQAKAILEWWRLERPLPLTDGAISTWYIDLFNRGERLHPFCVGFTNMHREIIERLRLEIEDRAERLSAARMNIKGEMCEETRKAYMAAMKERDMFNETFRRQAEIDSGYRTITASDDQFSFRYLMVENSFYDYAMAKIESDVERENLHNIFLEYWTGRVQSRFGNGFLTEFSVREEITGLDHFLEASDALYHTIDTFRGEVIRWHHLDEMSFDFQPNDRDPHSDSAPGLTQDSERAIGFRQWAAQYERQMGRRVKPAFSRWYILLGAYKAYLIQTAPAQYTRFNEIRDSIAANSFRNLLERFRLEDINVEMGPELEPSAPEPSEEEELSLLQWLGEDWSGLLEGEELDDLLQWLGEDWDGQLP